MLATIIGIIFIIFGVLWAFVVFIIGGMTEYRATWRDIPWQIVFSVPIILIGVAIVWR